jgi:hypothetical protein
VDGRFLTKKLADMTTDGVTRHCRRPALAHRVALRDEWFMMLVVKALFFDVFGTLVDWRTSIAREAEATLKPRGHAFDWAAFADAITSSALASSDCGMLIPRVLAVLRFSCPSCGVKSHIVTCCGVPLLAARRRDATSTAHTQRRLLLVFRDEFRAVRTVQTRPSALPSRGTVVTITGVAAICAPSGRPDSPLG